MVYNNILKHIPVCEYFEIQPYLLMIDYVLWSKYDLYLKLLILKLA